jgi:hypothetical protein
MRACTWCKEKFELVEKNGHLTCPECGTYLVRKGEPGFDDGFGSRIGKDEYWVSYYYGASLAEPLVQIEPAQKPDPA